MCIRDRFHRVYVLKDLGQISWAFDYYEINEGYDIEDLYDEIGLGANNHPPSSKATRKDFLNRAIKWSKRVGGEVTKEQLIEWIDGIEHTFTDRVVENIANDVLHAKHIDNTFVSFTDDAAAKYLREDAGKYTSDGEIDEEGFAGRLVRAEANGTYVPRNFMHILKDAKKGKRSKVHIYIPSNQVKKFYFDRPSSNLNQKVLNLSLSKNSVEVNSTIIKKPNPKLIRDPMVRKNDIYALEFYNSENELIYKIGIGDPFMVRLQHIDMEDKEHYAFEAPISNFNVVIPMDINPSYVSLIRRNNENIYSEVSRYILN